jgi:hypothetical protein
MLKVEGTLISLDNREKDGKSTFFALVVDGMETYKVSSNKPFVAEKGKIVSLPVRVTDFKGNIYYSSLL